ncbi:MAG: paraquat-inducible protein A [Burkholderiales bacterium]
MPAPLVACHECDLLQREVPLRSGGVARCVRCGAELYRDRPASLDRALALTAGALLLFAIANSFPILGLALQGQVINATLYDTVDRLWDEDMKSVAALVFATTIAMPALELAALAYLLVPVRFGRLPPHFGLVFRVLQAVRPWGMVEVFMLGVLVSLVKLAHLAGVVPGVALWSFAALMLVMAAIAAVFDPRALWDRAGAVAQAQAAR